MMAFIGVRISWLMVAKKVSLASLACSAACLAASSSSLRHVSSWASWISFSRIAAWVRAMANLAARLPSSSPSSSSQFLTPTQGWRIRQPQALAPVTIGATTASKG